MIQRVRLYVCTCVRASLERPTEVQWYIMSTADGRTLLTYSCRVWRSVDLTRPPLLTLKHSPFFLSSSVCPMTFQYLYGRTAGGSSIENRSLLQNQAKFERWRNLNQAASLRKAKDKLGQAELKADISRKWESRLKASSALVGL